MTYTIRSATAADERRVLAYWEAVAVTQPGISDEVALSRLLRLRPASLLLAVEDDVIVGTIVAGDDGWRGALYRLSVRPDHRRRGVATTLVRAAEEHLALMDVPRVSIVVMQDDVRSRAFWTAMGYTSSPGVERWARNIGPAS